MYRSEELRPHGQVLSARPQLTRVAKVCRDDVDMQDGYRRRDVETCADLCLQSLPAEAASSVEVLQASGSNLLGDIDFTLDLARKSGSE
jgi:hypothetical protein